MDFKRGDGGNEIKSWGCKKKNKGHIALDDACEQLNDYIKQVRIVILLKDVQLLTQVPENKF